MLAGAWLRRSRKAVIEAVTRVGAILLLAFALRLFRLAHLGDLEFDEIVSVRYAALPIPELLPRLAGALFEHPPAFYALLGGWRSLLGDDDVLARLFSVLPGTLCIPLTYAVGRRAFGTGVGLLGSLAVAVGPLTLFYSREARMYGLVACLALASFWLLLREIERPRGGAWWTAYTLLGALTAYVHYLGALLVLFQVLAVWALRRRVKHAVRPVTVAGGVIVLVALPWVLGSSGGRASLPALSLGNLAAVPGALIALAGELAGGPDAPAGPFTVAGAALVVLALFGLPPRRNARVVIVSQLLAAAFGLLFALGLGKPVQARYILPAVPLLYLCTAHTVLRAVATLGDQRLIDVPGAATRGAESALARRTLAPVATVCGLASLLGAVAFWHGYYGAYARADYSAVTRRIAGFERTGDDVLLTGPWQAWYFDFYYPRSGGQLGHQVLPVDAPPALDPAQARAQLESLVGTYRRLWFVQAGLAQADPTNFVERWLQAHAWPALREPYENAVISLYALDEPAQRRALTPVSFGSRLKLTGGWAEAGDVLAGDVARFSFEFEATAPPGDLAASLRLVGADGQRAAVDFPLVDRQEEQEVPASAWEAGRHVVMRRGIFVPPSLGPQPYEVRLVVYDPATLRPLVPALASAPQTPGGEAPVGYLTVTQALAGRPLEPPAPDEDAHRQFGGGDEFDTIVFRGARWGQGNPSEQPISVDLLWQLAGFTGTEHVSTLSVVDDAGRDWADEARPLFGGTFNMHDWRDKETLAERRSLDLTHLPAGRYHVLLGLQDTRGRELPVAGREGRVELATFTLPYRRPWRERALSLVRRFLRTA
jgi:4-amino-4-deoxy-L-arabinose transferase-like glycosyltransferase